MKILAIVGHANSGKSTLIRNLTGIYRGEQILQLAFLDGMRNVFIKNSAVQEYEPRTPGELVAELNALQEDRQVDLIIIPFRIDPQSANRGGIRQIFPSGEEYLDFMERSGFDIELIIKLDEVRFASARFNLIGKNMHGIHWNIRTKLVRDLISLI